MRFRTAESAEGLKSVVVYDPSQLVADGLRAILGFVPTIEVKGAASSAADFAQLLGEYTPELAVIGPGSRHDAARLPTGRLVGIVRETSPSSKVVIAVEPWHSKGVISSAISAGIDSVVGPGAKGDDLLRALHETMVHGSYLSPEAAVHLLRESRGGVDDRPAGREAEVIAGIAFGHTHATIAEALSLSVRTVESHRARIADRFGLRKRPEIVAYALRNDLMHLDSPWLDTGGQGGGYSWAGRAASPA